MSFFRFQRDVYTYIEHVHVMGEGDTTGMLVLNRRVMGFLEARLLNAVRGGFVNVLVLMRNVFKL